MPTLDVLCSTAVESVAYGVLLGIALTIAVSITLRILAPLSAATRSLVFIANLAVLLLIPILYFATHIQPPQGPVVPVPQSISVVNPSWPLPQLKTDPGIAFAPAADSRFNVALPEHFAQATLALYIAIVTTLLGRLFVSYLGLRWLRHRTKPAASELAARLDQWLVRCPTSRWIELRLSDQARSPLAIGFRRPIIVMPSALVLELTQEEYDDLGVHELAHIRRYDDWTNLLQRFIQAILFFQPAAHYLARQLNLERELACDDWVVSAHESKSHQSKSYARCLGKVIELRRYQRGTLLLSSGAFFGKKQILKRVEALLDKTRNSATSVSSLTVVVLLVSLVAIVSQIAHIPEVIAFTQDGDHTTSMRWSDDARDLRIKLRGEITFSPDEQSISALSSSGFIIIDEGKGWSHRRLDVRSGLSGTPEERYFLDGREKAIDGVGRAWAAGMYLFSLRELGLDSEARVSRILARKGAAGVFQEVDLIHSDHVKYEYLTQLLSQAGLAPSELQRLTDGVRKLGSDNDKADFLIAHRRDLLTDEVRTSYFRAINSIHSDNDRRRILVQLLETDGHNPETARLIGQSAKEMISDNDKAEVLLAVPANAPGNTCALLNAARNIQSDNDKARVLRDTAYVQSTQCRDAYFAVVNLINSDNDRATVLERLLTQTTLDNETYRDIAVSAKAMNSDNDKANVLSLLAVRYSGAPLFDAVNSISSSNDRARVLKSVLKCGPPAPVLLNVIQSATAISADNEKAEILLAVAKQSNQSDVRSALQKACEKLTSDNDYRRVASAIFNQPVAN